MNASPVAQSVPYRPLPLAGPHLQTILASQITFRRAPPSTTRLVDLPDGDRIALAISTPPTWTPRAPTVVLIHGLCGCQDSGYLVRLARHIFERGGRAVRMNLRGCGTGLGLARRPYHSGRSEDVRAVLADLRAASPDSPTTVVGFSLGGNMVLKMAGEDGVDARALCDRVVAVCPPADLLACAHLISMPHARIYDRYFVSRLRDMVADRHARFPDLGPVSLPRRLTLYGFDDAYTAPQCGFSSALDYYRRASAKPLVEAIAVPCRVLFARDDPFIDPDALDDIRRPANVEVTRVDRGGHLGFLGTPLSRGGVRWMDRQVLAWLDPY